MTEPVTKPKLVTVANKQFQLPEGLEFKELGRHPRNSYALVSTQRVTRDNPLGVIDSVDARSDESDHKNLLKLLTNHGAVLTHELS